MVCRAPRRDPRQLDCRPRATTPSAFTDCRLGPRRPLEEIGKICGRHGPREIKALGLVAADGDELGDYLRVFDPFGHGLELEAAPEVDDGPDERLSPLFPVAMPSMKALSIFTMSTGKRRR